MNKHSHSLSQDRTVVSFEWKITGIKKLLDSTAGEKTLHPVRSPLFDERRWRVSFYPNEFGPADGKDGYAGLYLTCQPTPEEYDAAETDPSRWVRNGLYRFCFEMLNTSKTVSHEAKTKKNPCLFSWEIGEWGWPEFIHRDNMYQVIDDSDAIVVICTIMAPREATLKKGYADAAVQTQLDSLHQPDSSPLLSLLAILRGMKAPMNHVATIDLVRSLLTTKNYVTVALEPLDPSDAKILLDLILHLICSNQLTCSDMLDANPRARRLMLKMITKMPIIPSSLFVEGIRTKVDYDYIGQGGFGFVFKGELGGSTVALKWLYKTRHNNDFCREALTWRSLNHERVLPLLGIYEDESSHTFLVSPYMTNGTLSQWRNKNHPSTAEILRLMLEVAEGMYYIHSEGIVHGDIRGDNILLDTDFHVKIADFGLTRHVESTATQSGVLHYNFAAPELLGNADLDDDVSESDDDGQLTARTQKSDIYAFGCLYYEIQFDTIPFKGIHQLQIARLVCQGERPPRMNEPPLSDKAWRLIRRCWVREAVRRPAMESILEKMVTWKPA